MALVRLSPSALISARKTARFSVKLRSLRVGVKANSFCSIEVLVVAWRATSTLAGLLRKALVIRSISGAMVAEKNSVWRVLGVIWKMRSISGMNPISSIRSASSTTMICTPVNSSLPRSKWSSRRPGVAISTSTPRSISLSWSPNDTPPISKALVSLVYLAYLSKLSATWAASSRVGASTRERGMRARARPWPKSVIMGRVKPAVLPVPVWAMPKTS